MQSSDPKSSGGPVMGCVLVPIPIPRHLSKRPAARRSVAVEVLARLTVGEEPAPATTHELGAWARLDRDAVEDLLTDLYPLVDRRDPVWRPGAGPEVPEPLVWPGLEQWRAHRDGQAKREADKKRRQRRGKPSAAKAGPSSADRLRVRLAQLRAESRDGSTPWTAEHWLAALADAFSSIGRPIDDIEDCQDGRAWRHLRALGERFLRDCAGRDETAREFLAAISAGSWTPDAWRWVLTPDALDTWEQRIRPGLASRGKAARTEDAVRALKDKWDTHRADVNARIATDIDAIKAALDKTVVTSDDIGAAVNVVTLSELGEEYAPLIYLGSVRALTGKPADETDSGWVRGYWERVVDEVKDARATFLGKRWARWVALGWRQELRRKYEAERTIDRITYLSSKANAAKWNRAENKRLNS